MTRCAAFSRCPRYASQVQDGFKKYKVIVKAFYSELQVDPVPYSY